MAKSKNRWDVIYETVDEKNKKLIPHFAAQNVDWKTALMVKRNNKFIAMEIRPTKREPDRNYVGANAPLQAESTPEVLPIEEAESSPALRN